MGVTLLAILTAALLLPGIIASHQFYWAAKTSEVDVFVPPLSTSGGLALIGLFSVATHALFIVVLMVLSTWPTWLPLPLPDPYKFFSGVPKGFDHIGSISLIGSVAMLCFLAIPIGRLTSAAVSEKGDQTVFYGPLASIIEESRGDDAFVAAYILTKIEEEGSIIGYQGVVDAIVPDENRMPKQVILTDVAVFVLKLDGEATKRIETQRRIGWLTINASDWHNIAFKVFREVDANSSRPMVSADDYVNLQREKNREAVKEKTPVT